MGLPGPKTLNHQRTPFPIIGSQLFRHEHATSCVTIPKLYECQGDIRVFVQLNMTKPTQSCLYVPAPGNNLCRKLSPMLPSKPSLLPVYKARPFSPKPIPPRLLIHHLLHILLPGVWAKSRMRFLIPCSCMFRIQLTSLHSFISGLPMTPFSLSTLPYSWLWPHQLAFSIALLRPHYLCIKDTSASGPLHWLSLA